jgi:acyl-CoA thioesterase YciA
LRVYFQCDRLRNRAASKEGILLPSPPPKSDDNEEVAPTSAAAIRSIAMPADTNPHGDIFGGWLLCQMDLAGSTVATRRADGRVVTVAITAMTFHRPVSVGDEVSCYCSVERIGDTSIAINIESWVRRGCVIRRKAAGDSDAIRPPIPTEVGHPFRLKPATLVGVA